MPTVGTTAVLLMQGDGRNFVVEADPGNSGSVKISSQDPTVTSSFITLIAGQQIPFSRFNRSIWALGSAAGQLVYVEFTEDKGQRGEALTKGP